MARDKIDRIALEIVKYLQSGRRSFKEIGLALGLSEATIRVKVSRLIRDGLLEIKALVATQDMEPGYQTAYMGLRVKTASMKKTAEAISLLPGVISVAIITGRFDFLLTVMYKPDLGFVEFYNALLERHSDSILGSETFLVYDQVNLKTPYPY